MNRSRNRTRRAVVALAAALGVFAVTAASPVSAGSPDWVSGVVSFDGDEIEVGGAPTTECTAIADFDLDFSGTTTGTWSLSAFLKVPFRIPGSAADYQMEIVLSDLGDLTHNPWGGSILAQISFQALTECNKTNLCEGAALLIVDPSSTHVGSLPNPAVGDVTQLILDSTLPGGFNVQILGTCPAALASFVGNQPLFFDLILTWWRSAPR